MDSAFKTELTVLVTRANIPIFSAFKRSLYVGNGRRTDGGTDHRGSGVSGERRKKCERGGMKSFKTVVVKTLERAHLRRFLKTIYLPRKALDFVFFLWTNSGKRVRTVISVANDDI